ncbi:MAG: hypothetical protein M1300_11075 [Epsilonproteobacteria bacterium]|nr:hypothetical protein [Campylobacterota bacterium]
MLTIKKEIFFEILKSKIFKAFIIGSLILSNFVLAGVEVTFSFVLIVFIFSYLAATGILYRKAKPKEIYQERFKKVFTFANVFIVLQKWVGYLFLAIIVAGVVMQLYFRYFN